MKVNQVIVGIFVFLFVFTSFVSAVDGDDRNFFEKIWDFLFGEEPQLAPGKALDQGLVLYLPFDGNFLDASGNGYDAVVSDAGTPVSTTGFDGGADGAYYFDGDDLLEVPGIPVDALSGNYTISFWVNFDVFMDNYNNANGLPGSDGLLDYLNILSNEDSAGSYSGFVFDGYPNGDNLYYYPVLDGDPGNDLVGGAVLGGVVGNWTHITVTYDQNILRFYLNGVEFNNNIGVAGINNPVNNLHIGGDTRMPPERFINASLDELRIYSRALDATEVWALRGICTDDDGDGWVDEVNESYCTYYPGTFEIVSDNPPVPYFNDCDDSNNTKMIMHDLYNDADEDTHGVDPVVGGICESWNINYPRFATYLDTNNLSTDNTDCDDADADRFSLHIAYNDSDADYFGVEPTIGTLCSASALSNLAMLQSDQITNGVAIASGDCDNSDSSVYPGATEINDDGIDQNCDGYDGRSCVMNATNPPFPEGNVCDGLSECHTDWWCLPNVCVPQTVLADGTLCTSGTCQAGVCVSSTSLYVPFDSDINDYSSNGFVPITTSVPTPSSGVVNGAYSFDGISNYVEYGDITYSLPLTLMGWVNTDKLTHSSIVRTDDSPSIYSGAWLEITSTNILRAGFGDAAGDVFVNRHNLEAPADVVTANNWHHVAGVISGVNDIQIYVDGNPIAGTYYGGAAEFVSSPGLVSIGKREVYGPDYYNGMFDEIKIVNAALLQADIQAEVAAATTSCTDADGDGWVAESAASGCDTSGIIPFNGYGDCADSNINVFPGQIEDCGNGIDDDCDTYYDYGENNDPLFRLGDNECTVSVDSMGVSDFNPPQSSTVVVNCNTSVFSEGTESLVEGVGPCTFIDFSCGGSDSICNFNCNVGSAGVKNVVCYIDGRVDHQLGSNLSTLITVQPPASLCTDGDGDGWVAESAASGCDASGIIPFNGYDDCDDIVGTTYPGALETCDNVDNDCSSGTADGSGETWYGNPTACGVGICENNGVLDCVDGKQSDTCTELPPQGIDDLSCDGLDNNCDGFTDEDYIIDSSCFLPGECSAGNVASSCTLGVETMCSTGSPSTEICDGLDNDCTGTEDDNLVTPLNTLQDGVCTGSTQVCNGFLGWFDDYSGVANYEATELTCDDVLNNDCDLTTDCGDNDCSLDPVCVVQTYPDSYTLDLTTGWNYVSVPLRELLEDGVSKFNSDIVLEYNDGWDVNYKDIISEVGFIEPLKGYVVYSASDQSIVFNGTLNETYFYPLGVDNWNLVGSPVAAFDFGGNQLFNESSSILPGDVILGNAYWVYTGSEPQLAQPSAGFWDLLFGLFKY